jgi:hypothetical protein
MGRASQALVALLKSSARQVLRRTKFLSVRRRTDIIATHWPVCSVSIMAHKIQHSGMIRYTRGNITILDRDSLEECACECCGTLRTELKVAFS